MFRYDPANPPKRVIVGDRYQVDWLHINVGDDGSQIVEWELFVMHQTFNNKNDVTSQHRESLGRGVNFVEDIGAALKARRIYHRILHGAP